jgi:SAM-dependent methyltransferase
MREQEDAYGRLLLDHLEGRPAQEIVERDDGFIAANRGPAVYFAPYPSWPSVERRAMRYVRGRILDVGCGAGRAALRLQERGHDVVAVDISPLAVEVARRRGVRDALELPFERIETSLGTFDTVLMLGNNFGLVGSAGGARRALHRLHGLTGERGRIVAESTTPREPTTRLTSPTRNAIGSGAGFPATCVSAFATATSRRRGSTTSSSRPQSWSPSRTEPDGACSASFATRAASTSRCWRRPSASRG